MKNVMFNTETEARVYFKTEVEACELCGLYSASQADHDHGNIVSVNDDYPQDRICLECDQELDLIADVDYSDLNKVPYGC